MEPTLPAKSGGRGKTIVAVIGGAATVLSLVFGFIAIYPILTQSSSGIDKFAITVEPYRTSDLTVYSVPTSAPFAQFPSAPNANCTTEQSDWLASNGTAVPTYFQVTISNRATSGNVLGFSNLVGQGESADPRVGALLVECDRSGDSQPRIAPARLVLSSGTAAFYDRSRLEDAGVSPDTPVIYNLQPGESGQFVLQVLSSRDFTGDVLYTVTSGSDTAVKTLTLDGPPTTAGTLPWPARPRLTNDPIWDCLRASTADNCVGQE